MSKCDSIRTKKSGRNSFEIVSEFTQENFYLLKSTQVLSPSFKQKKKQLTSSSQMFIKKKTVKVHTELV